MDGANVLDQPKVRSAQVDPAWIPPDLTRPHSHAVPHILMALTWAGLLLRLVLSAVSLGSNDWVTWRWFGALSLVTGPYAYGLEPALNHPPIPVIWSSASLLIASFVGISFPFLFRLPAILADLGSCILLRRIWTLRSGDARAGWIASAAMAWNLDAILVGAFHCNTDNVCVFLTLLAVYQVVARRHPGWAGLALAGAINIKLIPILFLPLLLVLAWNAGRLRGATRFLVAVCLGAVVLLLPMLVVQSAYHQNVFRYNPQSAEWGIMYILMNAWQIPGWEAFFWRLGYFYVENGRYVVLAAAGCVAMLAWRAQQKDGYDFAALVSALFLILTPGFGFQYSVYAVPLLLASSVRWGFAYGSVVGLYLLIAYLGGWDGKWPAQSILINEPNPLAIRVAFASWVLLGVFALSRLLGLANRTMKSA